MKNLKVNIFIFAAILLCFQTAKSQSLLSPAEIENFLDKAEGQSQKYSQVFRNLSAQETKTKVYYKTNGDLDEKRVIKSLFIVYESPETKRSQEYRNVLEVDGKDVARDDKATAKFFAKLGNADSSREEYKKLFDEGTRYDGRIVTWGTTLSQERPFTRNRRPFFSFKLIGKDKIEGRDVFVLEYQQTQTIKFIVANPTEKERKKYTGNVSEYSTVISGNFQPTNPLISGKIWLDVETAQIWRNEFQVNLNPENLSKPIVSIESVYEYQTSDFGILVPKKALIRGFRIKGKNDENLSVTKDAESIYEYTKFSEFKTEAKDYEIKEN